ncbi:MAG: MFS transporter [Acidimicrobiales bacterium]|nr:MFS transporter [Acidimicrobiales bacterium]
MLYPVGWLARQGWHRLEQLFGGPARTRVIVILACVLALSSADTATVGASATQLRAALHISNTDIGLLVAVTSVVAAVASIPFGTLADRFRRTRTLGLSIVLWGIAMLWSASVGSFGRLLLARLFLGAVMASAGPVVASMVGDFFSSAERGRIYAYILTGELLGAGLGFAVTGDIAALSWRAAFVILALPAFALAVMVLRLPEPARGGAHPLPRLSFFPRSPNGGGPVWAVSEDGTAAPPAGRFDPGAPGGDSPEGSSAGTEAQRLARDKRVRPHAEQVLRGDARRMGLRRAVAYVLSVRTNVILIISSACAYYFLAGVQTFGVEFVKDQYGVDQALANLLMLVVGAGAVVGVLAGGSLSDHLLRRRYLNARVLVAAVAAVATTVLFIPAVLTRSLVTALPYLVIAALALSAQNPPIDAARLDIMPPLLWGRAEGVRTFLRTAAQAVAPLLFGAVSDYVFGGGRGGLQWTFVVMLLPLLVSGLILFKALRTYPRDVATAAMAPTPDDARRMAAQEAGGQRGAGGSLRPPFVVP